MHSRVLLFASLRERAGERELQVDIPDGITVAALREHLAAGYPWLAPLMSRVAVAVNEEYAPGEQVLRPGDTIALIPPVSGG